MDLREEIERWIERFKEEYEFEMPERDMGLEDVRKAIEHTNLKPTATADDIERLCKEALENGFYGVCVNPWYVPMAKKLLDGTEVKVVTVCGFPLGANKTEIKVSEAKMAVEDGADEIDMVLNIGALKDGRYEDVYEDIKAVVEAVEVPVKVIIETCYLTDEEKVAACVLAKRAGAKFVKTSTGFGSAGAKVEDVHLMKWVVVEDMGVKAAGGIRDLEKARNMLRAGAERIGTSSGVKIVRGDES